MRLLKRGNLALLAWALPRRSLDFCGRGGGGGGRRRGRDPRCLVLSCRPSTKAPSTSACNTTREYPCAKSNRLGLIAERLLMDVPEVASVGRRTGRAELDEHAEGVHFSEIDVDLKPSSRTRDEILARYRARLAVLPASVSVGQPIAHRMDHMLSGIRAEIALKIYGDDLDTLRNLAETLRGAPRIRERARRSSGRKAELGFRSSGSSPITTVRGSTASRRPP